MMHDHCRPITRPRSPQKGVAAVEFALIASLFFTLLFGAIEVGRVLWLFNAANEVTRFGARLAVVCSPSDKEGIKTLMKNHLGLANTSQFTPSILYLDANGADCSTTPDTCLTVTVQLNASTLTTSIPFVNFSPALPPFSTTLSRESLSSTNNTMCQP